jgi:molybdopterin-guanine dinucleotide biosynthesis protein A
VSELPRETAAAPSADVAAIVLAGGRAERFGGPKLQAAIDGMTVLDRAILAVDRVATSIVVAGPEPASPPPTTAALRAIADDEPFGGPLAALSGAMHVVDSALAIVVAGDMPALVPEVLALLLDRLRSDHDLDAAILEPATSGATATAKTAVLPVALRVRQASAAAAAALAAGDRSLVRLLGRLAFVAVPSADWLALDPEGRTLLDVDTRADLDRLRGNEIR